MDTSIFYNLQLEIDIKDAIDLIASDPSNDNKKILINLFNNNFDSNKATLFEMFRIGEDGSSILSAEQQKVLFDNLQDKQKGALFNTIDTDARKRFYDSLSSSEASKFKEKLRDVGVDNAYLSEIDLLDDGYCTRDWDLDQLREMYQFKNKGKELKADVGRPHEFGVFGDSEFTISVQGEKTANPGKVNIEEKAIAGHHMMAVKDYPEFMADGKNIQFLDVSEHLQAHGEYTKNATLAFFDGENYIGIKYNEPYINELGEYVEGQFLGDGKMYKFVADNGKKGHFEEIIVDPDTYSQLIGKRFPPVKISTNFPSIKEASYLLGGNTVASYTAEELFQARLGIAEYRKLGIDIQSAHDPQVAEYLKSVGKEPSNLSKTTIVLNEEGNIDEVILKLDDSQKEIKIVASSNVSSGEKYRVTAADYKKMTALPDDITKESIGLRYHGTQLDDLTPIDKLKLRKADAIFAEKSLYLSLDDLDDADLIKKMISIADDPEIANRAVFSFNEEGRIVGFDLTGEIPENPKGCFSAKFSELRNAPSDFEIMNNYHAFGYESLDEISDLTMHKMRAGVAMYQKVGVVDDLGDLLELTASTEVENGVLLRNHLLAIADDPDSLLDTKFFFDGEGKLKGIGTKKPASAVFEMNITEVKSIPTDNTMRNMLNGYDDLSAADRFSLRRAVANGDSDEFIRIISENAPDDAAGIRTLITKADNNVSDAAVLLEGTKGDYDKAIDLVARSNDDAKGAIVALNSTDNNVDDAFRMLEKTGGKADDIARIAEHSTNFRTAEELFEFTGRNADDTIRLLDSLKGNSDDALRLAERIGGDKIDDIIDIVNKTKGSNIEDTIKLVDSLKGKSDDILRVLEASNGDPTEALKVLKNTDSVDDAIKVFEKFGGELSESALKQKYTFLKDDPDLFDLYRSIEYKIALGADPTKLYIGEAFSRSKIRFVEDNWILFKDIKDLRADDFLAYAMNEPCPTMNQNGLKGLEKVRGELKLTSAIRKGVSVGVNVVTAAIEIYHAVKFISSMAEGLENGTLTPRDVGKETTRYVANTATGLILPSAAASATIAVLGMLAVNPILIGVAAIVFAIGAGVGGAKVVDWLVDELYDPSYESVWAITDWLAVNAFGGEYHLIEGTNKNDKMDFSSGRINNGWVSYNATNPIDADGGYGDDIINGFIYDDILYGNDGNDTINGDAGDDEIYGGEGNDELHGDLGNDHIYGDAGVDFLFGEQGNDLLDAGDGDDYVWGGDNNDTIYGRDGSDHLYGEKGDDVIHGGNGEDYIEGGIGSDSIYGDSGEDYIDAGDDDDYIEGGNHGDVIKGGSGADIIHGETKEERFSKSGYDDYLIGGSGTDKIYGGAGNDYIWGNLDNDTIEGGYGDDIIDGGLGNDEISGGEGSDTLMGDSGDDTVYGGNGNDTIDGGYGNDKLYGGDGMDTFVFDKEIYGNSSNRGNVNDHDVVFDPYGINTVLFKSVPNNLDTFYNIIRFEKINKGHDLMISSKQTGASMKIERFFDYNNFTFEFDGDSYNTFILNDDLKLEKKKHNGGGGSGSSSMGNLADDLKNIIIEDFETAGETQPPRDPLIIDIDGNGVKTTDVADGVHFDIDNNGFAELTAWVMGGDGLLVYNRDDNPRITNGSELFSDQVYAADGTRMKDGFEVLKSFNKNDDTVISGDEFDGMQVWIDRDHNGETYIFAEDEEEDPNKKELYSIEELGIVSISFDYTIPEEDKDKPNQNLFAEVIFNDRKSTISEHWFNADTSDSLELNTDGIDNDLSSFGNLHSVSYAVENESDGYIRNLLDEFYESDDYVEKRKITRKILYRISGADTIARDSRGYYIDARDLHVLEKIMGVEKFIGVGNSMNPNSNAAVVLKNMYNKFEELYFNILNKDSKASSILDLICEVVDDNGNIVLNMDYLNDALDSVSETNGTADDMICSVCSYLKTYDYAHKTDYLAQFIKSHESAAESIARYNNAIFILGSESSDKFNGTNANEIFWGEDGNDIIDSGAGDDNVYGGDGNDTLNAGSGNDIAYGGTGDDTINGDTGNDLMYGEEGNDILNGGTGNDSIYAGEGDDTLNGDEGDDVLYGNEGDDALEGGEGNDALYGGDGNDTLSGGTGDDILDGGAGDDTYYINTEHGNDIIKDSEGLNTISFSEEISAEAYDLNIDINNGITLVNSETGETIGLPDFINVPEAYNFVFDGEGGMLGGGETHQVIEGTDGDDTITAGDGFNIIRGGDGNDTITGGDNLNFIYGGEGDDTITGGNGTNIIHGDEGNDTITDGSGSSYIDGGEGEDIIHAGEGNDIIIGGFGNDHLYGEDGDDVIAGNAGDDEIYGGNGDDTVYADAGNDTVHGGAGNDSLFGGNGYDTLYGDDGDDYLEAGNGEDNLYGGTGNDVLVGGTGVNNMYGDEGVDIFHGGNGINNMYGGDGDDTFTGGELADYIEGGSGNDTMNGGNGENRMFGNDGNDHIYGGNDNDYIEGGDGNDELYGGNGINTIYGGTGSDKIFDGDENSFLYGGDGDDEIRAGGGSDVLDGGAGNDYLQSDHGGDTYIFGIGYDVDTIHASADLNTIVIHGYTADDMHNTRMPNNDLVVDFGTDTGDRLVIEGFFNFNTNRDFNFVFDDETVLEQNQIEAVTAPIYGTSGNDQLFAVDNSGWSIIGGDGNDKLNGGTGNDILDGGTGDDVLNGGTGANTYVYGVGYDIDTIEASADSCTIVIHGYNAADMNSVRETDKSLAISFGDETGDKLIIKSFYEDYLDRNYQFVFDDGTVLGKSDINAKAAPIIGTDGDDNIYATNGDDIIDGGAGNDSLAGSNGEDTYIFGKGYDHDSINEWGSDHSFVVLKDINSDAITVSDQWGSNLLISVNDTDDVLTVSNFKWGQATYTFSFADGAEGYVDKNTWELVLTKQPDPVEEADIEQASAELLSEIYGDETLASDLLNGSDSTAITDITDVADISGESDAIADITDIQTMILAENMSAFSNDSQVSDGINISDITTDASGLDQLLVSSSVQ